MNAEKSMCRWQGHKLGNSPWYLCFILYELTVITQVVFS